MEQDPADEVAEPVEDWDNKPEIRWEADKAFHAAEAVWVQEPLGEQDAARVAETVEADKSLAKPQSHKATKSNLFLD